MLVGEALAMMNLHQRPFTVLFVVEDGKPVGIVHMHDFLRIGVRLDDRGVPTARADLQHRAVGADDPHLRARRQVRAGDPPVGVVDPDPALAVDDRLGEHVDAADQPPRRGR